MMKNVKEWKISVRTCVLHLKYQLISIIMMLMRLNFGCIANLIQTQMKHNRFWSAKLKIGIPKKSTNHLPYIMQTVQVIENQTIWFYKLLYVYKINDIHSIDKCIGFNANFAFISKREGNARFYHRLFCWFQLNLHCFTRHSNDNMPFLYHCKYNKSM